MRGRRARARSRRRRGRRRSLPRRPRPRLHRHGHRSCSRRWPQLAERNAALNGMGERVRTIVHDLARAAAARSRSVRSCRDQSALSGGRRRRSLARSPARRWPPSKSSADLARWLAVATGAAKSAGTLLLIHRSDRLEEIVGHLGRLGWGDVTIKRLPPARARAGARPPAATPAAPKRRRWCCTGRRAATPTRPRRSCATPRRLPSEACAATVPAMLGWLRDRFRRGPVVPVVRLSGVIASSGLLGGRSLSIESVAPLLKRAFDTRGAKAVALAINSPGGSPVQSALIGQRIRLLADEKGLKVIAFVEDVAASGGYWLACAADEIIVDPPLDRGLDRRHQRGLRLPGPDRAHRRGAARAHVGRAQVDARSLSARAARGCRAAEAPAGRDP